MQNATPIKAATYRGSGIPIQNSFKFKSHTNLNINDTAETSAPILDTTVFVSASVYSHIAFGHEATIADMLLPPGMWSFVVDENSTISVIKAGTPDGVMSIIIPEL